MYVCMYVWGRPRDSRGPYQRWWKMFIFYQTPNEYKSTINVFRLLLSLLLPSMIKLKSQSWNSTKFNSRLPASSQHHIKYFNPKKAHPWVILRILSHHASKSVKALDLCACLRKQCETKSFQLLGGFAPDSLTTGSAPGPRWGQARSYVQARGGSCLLIPRRLNFFETQINVMRNCVKRKKYDRKS